MYNCNMKLTKEEIKKKYFKKVHDNAPMVLCACGCGRLTKSKDRYGRDKKYINGHNNRKYSDPKQYKREWNHNNRSKRQAYKCKWINNFKKELIIRAGGKCMICGIEFDGECTAIFDFHHQNPHDKKFNVNNSALARYSKSKITEEAQKCDLLCANCHRLIHWDWKAIKTADSR